MTAMTAEAKQWRGKRILDGYVRAVQKARSNALEANGESVALARDFDPVLFGDDLTVLMEKMADRSDSGSWEPVEMMNFTTLMRLRSDRSPGLMAALLTSLDTRDFYLEEPHRLFRDLTV